MNIKTLNFSSKNPCFSKALVCWRETGINGLWACEKPILDLSQEDPTELLMDLFFPLCFVELCLLYQAGKEHPHLFQAVHWSHLFEKQKIQFSLRNLQLWEKLKQLPPEFLKWAGNHALSPQELMPVSGLDKLRPLCKLGPNFEKLKLSRNEGRKVLDILVDLILMGVKTEELMPSSGNWLNELNQKRYPNSFEKDFPQKMEPPWPQYVRVKNFRQGDQVIHQMQITYGSQDDLGSKLKHLCQIQGKNHV